MRKLAIVGSHDKTRHLAPFDDPDYEIWVFNEAPMAAWCKRWDAVFQMHNEVNYTAPVNWVAADYWQWLQTDHGDRCVWMQRHDSRVPGSQRYPLDMICDVVPGADLRWFTSTGAYALALGLYLGYQTIDIYGMELSSNTEYSYQLPNWLYWVGVAKGMGIKLGLFSGQDHFADRLYAYEGETQIERSWFAARAAELDELWKAEEKQTAVIRANIDLAINGRRGSKLQPLIIQLREQSTVTGQLAGAMAEAEKYAARPDPITRQEYERRAAGAQKESEGHKALMYHAGGKVEYVMNVWLQTGNPAALSQLHKFIQEMATSAYDCGAHLGIYQENAEYMLQYDNRLQMAGGQRALAAVGLLEVNA